MHLLASLTEQENVKSFSCDHISPWPLHHMVEKPEFHWPPFKPGAAAVKVHAQQVVRAGRGTQVGNRVLGGATPWHPCPQETLGSSGALWVPCPPLHGLLAPGSAPIPNLPACLLCLCCSVSIPTCSPSPCLHHLQAEPTSCLAAESA